MTHPGRAQESPFLDSVWENFDYSTMSSDWGPVSRKLNYSTRVHAEHQRVSGLCGYEPSWTRSYARASTGFLGVWHDILGASEASFLAGVVLQSI